MEHLIRQITFAGASAALAAVLAGCSTGGGGDDTPDDSPEPAITSFRYVTLTGSDGVTSAGGSTPVPAISPSINSGRFELDWDVLSSSPYRIEWILSTDAIESADDLQFFARNCSLDVPGSSCRQAAAHYECTFDSQNVIACDGGTLIGDSVNLTSYLSRNAGLPASYRVIAKACNSLLTSCATTVFTVSMN